MTDLTNIPLNKLTAWKGNVRKTQDKAALAELAASIKAHGLQQNLVVKKDGKTFAVVAGCRRLKALQQLAKAGDIPSAHPVPCRIADAEHATEISLAENVIRQDMHPADQFEAFRKLAEAGVAVVDIATRFGKTEAHVMRLLRLARVSPKALKAYRKGEIALDDVMAFAVTDDQTRQDAVLDAMAPWQGAREIRAALTENDVAATDRRVAFVTLKAYEKAGGRVRRDLFTDADDGVYLDDIALLDAMAVEKLDKAARPVRAEGWKWVETRIDFGYAEAQEFKCLHAEQPSLSAVEAHNLAAWRCEYDQLAAEVDEAGECPLSDRLDELDKLIEAVEYRDGVFTDEQRRIAGAVVTIGRAGEVSVTRGLARREDVPKEARTSKAKEIANPAGLSASLIESLTVERSDALAASLLLAPDTGLALVACALAHDVFGLARQTVLKIAVTAKPKRAASGTAAASLLAATRDGWVKRLPADPAALWQWCLQQPRETLLDLLTFCAAATVDAAQRKADKAGCERLVHARQLAEALSLDMAAWFTPTAANYFGRIGRPAILEALTEARGQPVAPAWTKLKKAELAVLAEREVEGTGWLPEVLRKP